MQHPVALATGVSRGGGNGVAIGAALASINYVTRKRKNPSFTVLRNISTHKVILGEIKYGFYPFSKFFFEVVLSCFR
jgi:hypothetical protein